MKFDPVLFAMMGLFDSEGIKAMEREELSIKEMSNRLKGITPELDNLLDQVQESHDDKYVIKSIKQEVNYIQWGILRKLIDNCDNAGLKEFVLDMIALERFKYGDNAQEFFKMCEISFQSWVKYQQTGGS